MRDTRYSPNDIDASSAYVLTSAGLQTYKKITPGLVKSKTG
jgi:hypothetical protein